MSCVHAPDRLHCDKALYDFRVFVDYLIDILHHFNFNMTDTSVIMNSLSWYDFCAILPPKVRTVGFFLFVTAVCCHSCLVCHLTKCLLQLCVAAVPRSGELRTQKLKSHLVRTQSLNVLPFKPGVGQYIAIHATLTAKDFFMSIHLHFSKTSPDFFLRWLWLTLVPV